MVARVGFESATFRAEGTGVNVLKHYIQLRVKDLPKVLTWWLEWDSNLRPSGPKAPNPANEPPCPNVYVLLLWLWCML